MQHVKKVGAALLTTGLVIAQSSFASPPVGPVVTKENTPKYTISIGTEILDGDTTYQIGYPVTMNGVRSTGYFPFSELEWPLDVVMARVDGSVTFSGGWKMNSFIKKNLTEPDENMKDSDWITDSSPNRLDIFSESSISDFDALIFDIDLEYTFGKWKPFSFFGGVGYQYQKFQYESNLIRQYSPSGLSGYDYTGDGGVSITYDITYQMPYIMLGTDVELAKNFKLYTKLAFAPWVIAHDKDRHLLRENGGKVTKSDMDGIGILFTLKGKYNFTPNWYAELGVNATRIEVDGSMDQYYVWYGHFATNRVESESTQYSGFLTLGMNF